VTEDTETRTYESASARIEEIIRRLDSGEAGLRETLDLCREGRELVDSCASTSWSPASSARAGRPAGRRRRPENSEGRRRRRNTRLGERRAQVGSR
jgi:exodeoxyribonuclease VII small subunit